MSLCPDADRRAVMTDDEFWQDVSETLGYGRPTFGHPDDGDDAIDVAVSRVPCVECGADGACAWDADGRPLIHAIDMEDA